MVNRIPHNMTTTQELKNLRNHIDCLNITRIELSLAGYISDDHSCDLLNVVDALEDRFIALTNAQTARNWQAMTPAQREAKKTADNPAGLSGHHGTSIA